MHPGQIIWWSVVIATYRNVFFFLCQGPFKNTFNAILILSTIFFFSKLSTRSIPCTKLSFFFFFLVFSLFIKLIVTFFSYRQIAQAIHRVGVAFKAVQACLETVQSETRMFHLTTLFLQKRIGGKVASRRQHHKRT